MPNTTRRELITGGICAALLPKIGGASPVKSMLGADTSRYYTETLGPSAADYIQDGLIAMFDGVENIGYGLHDNNSNDWVNLTGECHLRGSDSGQCRRSRFEWTGNSIRRKEEFIGSSYGCMAMDRLPDFIDQMMSRGENTVEVCISPSPFSGNNFGTQVIYSVGNLYISQGESSTQFRPLRCGSMTRLSRNGSSDRYLSMVTEYDENGASFVAYANGIPLGSYKSTATGDPGGIYLMTPGNGNTHCLRFYNRALTPDEIAYNYQLDCERFGL